MERDREKDREDEKHSTSGGGVVTETVRVIS